MALKTISLKTAPLKIALLAYCLIISILMVFFAKWTFGNAVATQAALKEVAEFAVSLAPSDPQSHYTLAVLQEKTFLPEDLDKSLVEYETAVALAPHDYRLWLALGNSLGRNGKTVEAESAFKKALELAPNYAQIHWAFGNFLLRQGRTEEGFAEMGKAAETNETYLKSAVSTAWQVFDGNLSEVRKNFGSSPVLNSMIATFLAEGKRFDEALEIWNTFSDEDKKTRFKEEGKTLFRQMIEAKKYRAALEIYNQITASDEETFAAEQIANGSFEKDVKTKDASVFDWQLGDVLQPQVGFDDGQKTEGKRSLVILFNSADGKDFRNLSQNIVVQSDKSYELKFSYKSDLKTIATVSWQILDADNKVLAETENLSAKTDWAKITLAFKTPADAEVVKINLVQVKCPQGICPISGRIWFDDFQLGKVVSSQ
jgi:tetratricopeptide (TPR) repeat protein